MRARPSPIALASAVVDMPLGATEDRVVGALDLEQLYLHYQPQLALEENRVVGVATGDMGIGKDGERTAGYTPGMTTTDGVYIDGQRTVEGDMTGPVSARMVLADPQIDLAVLETADVKALKTGFLNELTSVQLGGIGSQQVAAMTSAQIGAIVASSA